MRKKRDEAHAQRNLVGYSPWVGKELDMTEHSTDQSVHQQKVQLLGRQFQWQFYVDITSYVVAEFILSAIFSQISEASVNKY